MFRKLLTTANWMFPVLLIISFPMSAGQTPISASQASISISGFTFQVTSVAFDQCALGFAPPNMKESDQVMFVEFKLLSGDEEDFKGLAIQVSSEAGQRYKPILLTAGGTVKMLATVTMTGQAGRVQPRKDHIAWIFVIPRSFENFQVHFPSGEIIDLAPLLEK